MILSAPYMFDWPLTMGSKQNARSNGRKCANSAVYVGPNDWLQGRIYLNDRTSESVGMLPNLAECIRGQLAATTTATSPLSLHTCHNVELKQQHHHQQQRERSTGKSSADRQESRRLGVEQRAQVLSLVALSPIAREAQTFKAFVRKTGAFWN